MVEFDEVGQNHYLQSAPANFESLAVYSDQMVILLLEQASELLGSTAPVLQRKAPAVLRVAEVYNPTVPIGHYAGRVQWQFLNNRPNPPHLKMSAEWRCTRSAPQTDQAHATSDRHASGWQYLSGLDCYQGLCTDIALV